MILTFIDNSKSDKRVVATIESNIIPVNSRGGGMDVIFDGKKYTVDNVTIDYINDSAIIEICNY
jgi:hypothetical protein